MPESTLIHHTFTIERSYPAAPARVFAAFSDAAQKRRWFIEGDHHEVEAYTLDFRVGGKENARLLFKKGTPIAGQSIVSEYMYEDIVPGSRIVATSSMQLSGKPMSVSLVTFEFLPSEAGTDLLFTHQAVFFQPSDGPAMRQDGWRKLFDRLAAELPL